MGLAQAHVSLHPNAIPQGAYVTLYVRVPNEVDHADISSVRIKLPNGVVRKTALAEGSGITGGYLVPPQYMAELLTIAAEVAWIEPLAKVVPMNTRTMSWPMLDITTSYGTNVTPYYGGVYMAWQPEAASINETEPQFKMSEWVAWDLRYIEGWSLWLDLKILARTLVVVVAGTGQ